MPEDLLYLVELFSSHEKVRTLSEYRLLERVWREQCRVTDSGTDIDSEQASKEQTHILNQMWKQAV